jgi:hypothetical protein
MATIQLDATGAQLLDAGSEALYAAPRPIDDAHLDALSDSLRVLARATHVRELESGSGSSSLPNDVELAYSVLIDGDETDLASGDHVYDGDRIVVRATNTSEQPRYVSVLDVGLSGAICILTNASPAGTLVERGQVLVVGENVDNELEGVEVYWPEHLPRGGPRPETILTICADASIATLPALEQQAVRSRSTTRGGEQSAIERLIDDAAGGVRDARPPSAGAKSTRYTVHRLDLVVHPTQRPGPDLEPAFEIDARSDPSYLLVTPRAAIDAPTNVSVRLNDLVVHSNRAFLKSKVRVDFLIVSAVGDDGLPPYRAETLIVDRVRDGDRLPVDRLLLYER